MSHGSPFSQLASVILSCWLLAGCGRPVGESESSHTAATTSDSTLLESAPLTKRVASEGPLFTKLSPDTTGVNFTNPIEPDHAMKFLYASAMATGGIAIGDLDADGRPDLLLVGGPGKNKLYRQSSDFKFEDVTECAGVNGGDHWGVGAAFVDIDRDGDLDIYVCNYLSANQLFINQGDLKFTEKAKDYGLDIVDASHTPAFCDYDQDGHMDLYLLTNRWYRPEGFPEEPALTFDAVGRPTVIRKYERFYDAVPFSPTDYRLMVSGRPDQLWRNNGQGRFTDVTSEAGIAGRGHGLSATWWDYDRDGRIDLYVGNDFDEPDCLYRNLGNGKFKDVIKQVVPYTSWFSMGADVGDLDNDGLLDFIIADMNGTTHYKQKTNMGSMGDKYYFMQTADPPQYMRNMVYLNTGLGRFREVGNLAKLAKSDWTWAVKVADFDNDGRVDIFFSNGMSRNFNEKDDPTVVKEWPKGKTQWDMYAHLPPLKEQNLAFRNAGGMKFDDVSRAWGLDHVGVSYATAYADFDTDGDLDLVVVNLDEPVHIYRNNSIEGHTLAVELRGTASNLLGVGTTVEARTKDGVYVRQLSPMTGYLSSNDPRLHFGLGSAERVDRLTVRWPSGHEQTFQDLPVDRRYTVREPSGSPPTPSLPQPPAAPIFKPSGSFLAEVVHKEKPYDDFKRQLLLPNKLSQLGPSMAVGDVNGDGKDDLFLGAPSGESGRLFRNLGSGNFQIIGAAPWAEDAACEDMGTLFFDADGDGDLDLYVVSGGVECEPQDAVLQDRLYMNDGSGHFTKAPPGTLPDERDSGSAVVAADFDRDGDLDLFVGGRVIPGRYPYVPKSHLLRNDGGKFTDITDQAAKGLAETGLVTAALWSDVDQDGWLDLLVAHEWGPIKSFKNEKGTLVDRTADSGVADKSGWYNGIVGRDLDGDGDVDYVVTNFGLNTKYHASVDHPVMLYYGELESDGKLHLVEAEYEHDTLFPVRGKSCSTQGMPSLANRFKTYREFALASLDQIYTPQCLEKAQKCVATTLESGVLLNDGKGRFTFRALPKMAQDAPGFGAVFTHLDSDGVPDLVLAQNFYSPQIETGRYSGGLGMVLAGRGDGSFDPIAPRESGLAIPGDAKSAVALDVNDDAQPDLVVAVNSDRLHCYELAAKSPKPSLANVRLQGPTGNPTGVGARVVVETAGGRRQTAEVYAGDGYLSQSSSTLSFAAGPSGNVESVVVKWPDGRESKLVQPAISRPIVVSHPDRTVAQASRTR